MATPAQRLAEALAVLQRLQADGRRVYQSRKLKRPDRELLLANGFLREAIPGWLIPADPGAREGDTTSWYASFWEFCARYCDERFGSDWHLSPEQSLLIHAEQTAVPKQVVVCSPKGANNRLVLPFDTSLYDLKQPDPPKARDLIRRDGLQLLASTAALVRVPDTFFKANPVEARVVLESIHDASSLLADLLAEGRTTVAGRLAGAFRHIHRGAIAGEILATVRAAGYAVRERNPFLEADFAATAAAALPPIVIRLRALWELARPVVVELFPKPPGLPQNAAAYLRTLEEIYRTDAYNSLSIEGYDVTPELIERVRSGGWNPDRDQADRRYRDALAARGYWQAFQAVKGDIGAILAGANPGQVVRASHRDWYRELFAPCVVAGLIGAADLAGYRSHAVYLRNSRHVPPRWETVREAMPAFFDLLEGEPSPAVRAVLGHWLFGYVHPYPDGNGRMARFLMNAMLASGGYPWTVIRLEDRATYLAGLEAASVGSNIRLFAEFVAGSMKVKLRAKP